MFFPGFRFYFCGWEKITKHADLVFPLSRCEICYFFSCLYNTLTDDLFQFVSFIKFRQILKSIFSVN